MSLRNRHDDAIRHRLVALQKRIPTSANASGIFLAPLVPSFEVCVFSSRFVTRQATLSGILDVSLIDEFVPDINDTFEILAAEGGVTGTFLTKNLPPIGSELGWDVNYEPTSVVLVVAEVQPCAWTNPVNPFDVNADGFVAPIDALLIINELEDPEHSEPDGKLLDPPLFPNCVYLDPSGDMFVSPLDALLVINQLNQQTMTMAQTPEPSAPLLTLLGLLSGLGLRRSFRPLGSCSSER